MAEIDLKKLLKSEAAAYLRSGMLAAGGARVIRQNVGRSAEVGVLFVSGVGANASQFLDMKETLSDLTDWFDAFEYWSHIHPERVARELLVHLEAATRRCERLVVIGHSLGGLLLRMVLQAERAPKVAGFVSICAPLHGTWRSRLSPSPALRALAPDSATMTELHRTAHRLDPLAASTLTIGVRHDSFIAPYDSAFLKGSEQLCLEDAGHVSALFDPRVFQAVRALIRGAAERAAPGRMG